MKNKWSIKSSSNGRNCAAVLTEGDGVDLALDLQRAVVAVEGVNDLFGLRVADRQVLRSLLILLQKAWRRGGVAFGLNKKPQVDIEARHRQSPRKLLTTFHFFPSSSRTGGFLAAGAADAAGRGDEEDAKGLGPLRTCVV